ncbi:MAG: HRDC domain-containing protein [Armatimonadetes bacterium]|nr:HRDC domain-containing protein [Armatimonadota bacterium]
MGPMLIQTNSQLVSFVDSLCDEPAIFIDTEFVGEGHYYARLGSVQIGTPTQAALVDPLAVKDLSPLGPILADPAVVKVFHAAGQDLQILTRLYGRPVAPVFDTQVAAQLLSGDEQISFDRLVTRITGKSPAAGHGFTDWLRRPLTPGQIEYALDDVRLLVPVYEAQRGRLAELDRESWAREEFAKLEEPTRFAPSDPEQQYMRVRGFDNLSGPALASLQALAAWREYTAREMDIPVGRIARDETLSELAMRPRKSTRELRDIRGLRPDQIDRYGADLLRVAQEGRAQTPPARRPRISVSAALEPTVDFMGLCLRSLAEQASVAATAVATRSDLVALVLLGEEADIALLRGWRRPAFGEPLLDALSGKAVARVLPDDHTVHLVWDQGH